LMDEIAGQIRSERDGLQKRYSESSANAGFLMAALDNDEAAPASSARLDTLTDELLNCERRLAALSRQLQLLDEVRRQAEGLLDDASPQASTGDAA
jgi:small-conductance mechanosensitive channel